MPNLTTALRKPTVPRETLEGLRRLASSGLTTPQMLQLARQAHAEREAQLAPYKAAAKQPRGAAR